LLKKIKIMTVLKLHFVTVYSFEWIYLYIDGNGKSMNFLIFTGFSNLTVTYYLNFTVSPIYCSRILFCRNVSVLFWS
jgi:hypothetical protein